MSFQKGRQKTGGRQKGGSSKPPKRKSFKDSLPADFNLAAELVELYNACEARAVKEEDGSVTRYHGNQKMRFDILKLIAKYTVKPVKDDDDEDDDEEESPEERAEFARMLKEALNAPIPKTEKDGVEGGGSILEAPRSADADLPSDSDPSEGST